MKDIPIEKFTISIHEDGAAYKKCTSCGEECNVKAIYSGADIIHCPFCGEKYDKE